MCQCGDIEIGSYANQTIVEYPGWFVSSKSDRRCGIDNCLLEEILSLWGNDIQTTESCCGHNKAPGYISVVAEAIPKMLQLGYKNLIIKGQPSFDENGFRADVFEPKTVRL